MQSPVARSADTASFLVADAHAGIREGVRLVLQRAVAARLIAEASHPDQAASLAAALHPDVVLLDPALDPTDELALVRRIRLASTASVVLLFAQHADPGLVPRARAAGARGVIVKDSGAATIARAVASVLAGGVFVDPQIEPVDGLPAAA
jgi:DNA-binding NarL/FixJ family response regulator